MKIVSLILCCFITASGLSQTKDTIQEKHEIFFKKMSKGSGLWVAENPKYDANKADDFKVFILEVSQTDPLKIDADILGVNTKNDTIGFWKFTDFYAPDKRRNLYYQRSTNGLYYASGEATMTETERYCEMSFYYSGGEYLKHKDTHTFIDENTMRSVSFDYDPKTQSWINESVMIWKRQ